MKVTFKITITKEYTLQITIRDQEGKERIIVETTPTITFNRNSIDICEEKENTLYFFKKWLQHPDDYSTYLIEFQNKTYNLLPEVFFSLIINEFRKKVEKEFIIENTEIQIEIGNLRVMERIRVSLDGIGMKGVEIGEDEEIGYEYSEQGEYLREVIEKKETIDELKRILEKGKEETKTNKEKIESIDIEEENMYKEDEFQ